MSTGPTRHLSIRRILPAVLALCVTLAPVATAQDVLQAVSPKRMMKILTSMGLEVRDTTYKGDDGKERPLLKFDLAGYHVIMFLLNENTDAQLYIGFGDTKIKTDKTNDWNQSHRFGRAYRDSDGDAVLESDIDFTGGVTEANIKAWVRLFRDQVGKYASYIQ